MSTLIVDTPTIILMASNTVVTRLKDLQFISIYAPLPATKHKDGGKIKPEFRVSVRCFIILTLYLLLIGIKIYATPSTNSRDYNCTS